MKLSTKHKFKKIVVLLNVLQSAVSFFTNLSQDNSYISQGFLY